VEAVLAREMAAIEEAEKHLRASGESKSKAAIEKLDMRGKEVRELKQSVEGAKEREDRERAIWAAETIKERGLEGAKEVIARSPYGYAVVDNGEVFVFLEWALALALTLILTLIGGFTQSGLGGLCDPHQKGRRKGAGDDGGV